MTTNWALPTIIEQYSESGAEDFHISWDSTDNFSPLKNVDGRSIKTSRDLLHIARDPRHDILQKTYFLKITGFTFVNLPSVIIGVELKLTMKRSARITDDTIQLTFDNSLIGENKATLDLDPIKIYGSQNDVWETNLTATEVQNSSFGVVLRFQSHPKWPHKTSALIDSVELRIH